ncbi:hypothetical protein MHYP_G00120990 [Metynnis hypsauchen]
MAPVCVAGRLFLLVWLVLLSFGTSHIKSLLVYDRQFLLDLRHNVSDLAVFNHGGQNTLPPLLSGIPTHLYRASASTSQRKRRRRRGKRSGQLVKLKVCLARSSSISRTGHGLSLPFVVSRQFLEPIDTCLVHVVGLDEGVRPRHPALLGPASAVWIPVTAPGSQICRTTGPSSCQDRSGERQITGKQNFCPEGLLQLPKSGFSLSQSLGLVLVITALLLSFCRLAVVILIPRGHQAVEEERRLCLKMTLNVNSALYQPQSPALKSLYSRFEPVTLSYLEDVVGHIKPSGSLCDVMPPHVFKEVFQSIGQQVLAIINSSLSLFL